MKNKINSRFIGGFTLAEVLITLGIIGIVAALTLPTLLQNINGKIRAEQIRTVKYKFTKATDRMNSLGLIGPYESTAAFVAELQKHLKIAKVCTASHLRECWPYDKVILQDGEEYEISKVQTGKQFKMKSSENQDYTSPNVGIVTADGTPMILSYNKKCSALDPVKQYGWSTEDNKPVSNATAGCVAAVFEINGTKKPNKQNQDVILFNANGLGSTCALKFGNKCYSSLFSPTPLTKAECEEQKDSLGIKNCYFESDYWAGAVKQCDGVSNMPSMGEISNISSYVYEGHPSIGAKEDVTDLIYKSGTATAVGLPEPTFHLWSGEERDKSVAFSRYNYPTHSYVIQTTRTAADRYALCTGD